MSFSKNPFSGFPFDNSGRDDRFQTKLEDLAKRHPEFADHLPPLQGWSRPRGPSTSHFREAPRQQQHHYTDNIFDRPFGSRIDFSNFGFDDTDAFFDRPHREEPFTHYQEQPTQPQQPQQAPEASHKPPQSSSKPAETKAPEAKPKPNPTLQQSNTVDLGQQQEPVDDCRNQRSMSAPPENRTGRRFVSSINIPNLNAGDMGARQSQEGNPQPSSQQQQNKPTERIIPIHIEGRDEPVMPKNVNSTFTSANAAPQPEKLFGQRPSNFTQFLNRNEQAEQNEQEELLRQQHMKQQQQDYQRQQQEAYQRQQQENFQRQQQEQQQQQQQQQPQQPSRKPTPLEIIQSIQVNVSDLMTQVEKFNGKPKDKEYLYLDEMLTRNLLKLDDIETEGKDTIRQARREAIKCIEGYINILEKKAAANEKALEEKMEVEKESTPAPDGDKKAVDAEIKSETEAPKLEETQTEVKKECTPEKILEKKDDSANEEKKEENSETKPEEIKMEQDVKEEMAEKPEETTSDTSANQASETKKEKAKVKKKK